MQALKDRIHYKILTLRRIENLINTSRFERAYKNAKLGDKIIIDNCIDTVDFIRLESKMLELAPRLTFQYLIHLCKIHQVTKYSRRHKDDLVKELINKKIIKEDEV